MELPRSRLSRGIAAAVLVLAVLLPRVFQLDHFVTPDELLWVARSANFYAGLRNGNLAATYQREHPGVTVMWAGSAAFLLRHPAYGGGGYEPVNWETLQSRLEQNGQVAPLGLLAAARLVVVLVITATLVLAFYFAQRLVGFAPAALSFVFIAFDPFQIGLSRLLHLDALLAGFMFLSLLAYLCYLREHKALHLLISALAAGLACLTKSPGILLAPVIGLLTLAAASIPPPDQSKRPAKTIWRRLWAFGVWLLLAAVAAVFLWPALWQKPALVLASILTNTQVHITEGHPAPAFFNGVVYQDGKISAPDFYLWAYIWRSTPAVLLGLALSAWALITRRKPFDQPGARLTAFGCLVLVLLFGIAMTLGAKKFDRYLLPAFPALCLLSGAGWAALLFFIREKSSRPYTKAALFLLVLAVVGSQMFASLSAFPYYLSYYNPVPGTARSAPQVMLIGWGEGLDEAGRYLSQKPNSSRLRVLSWLPYGCLSYYFPGKVRPILSNGDFSPEDFARLESVDYVVIYVQQWQLGLPSSLLEYLSHDTPEHSIWINGLEYARIYALH